MKLEQPGLRVKAPWHGKKKDASKPHHHHPQTRILEFTVPYLTLHRIRSSRLILTF